MTNSEKDFILNEDYFKKWSPNMSYIVGLYFAKGVFCNDSIIKITMAPKDRYLLNKIAKELNSDSTIIKNEGRNDYSLSIKSKEISNDMEAIIRKQESRSLKIPKKYRSDFLRGYFDGCGDFKNIKRRRLNCFFSIENKEVLKWIWSLLENICETEKGSYDSKHALLKFGTKDTTKIARYIYQGEPEFFISRKMKKFSENRKLRDSRNLS